QAGLLATHIASAAHVQVHFQRVARLQNVLAQIPRRVCLGERAQQPFLRQLVLAANKNERGRRLNREPRQGQAFNQLVRIPFHEEAVLERPRLHLISIRNDIFWSWSLCPHRRKAPLHSRRKACPATTAQSGILDFLLHLLRRHFTQGLAQTLVSTRSLIALQVQDFAIHRDVLRQRCLRCHGYLYPSSSASILARSKSPCNSLSTSSVGACWHAPRHTMGSNVKRLSGVVSPNWIPSFSVKCARMRS